jgi:glutamate--cysteine ligase catalytic subunit
MSVQPSKNSIPKSRYDSVDLYISNDWTNKPEYNDAPAPYNTGIFQRLRNHGEYRAFVTLL